MKKIYRMLAASLCMAVLLAGCGSTKGNQTDVQEGVVQNGTAGSNVEKVFEGAVAIKLSDEEITVDGSPISEEEGSEVYAANDIVYYPEGKDFKFGEGTEEDAHSKAEADAHRVVHITKPGTYTLSGSLSAGQIAVDLGKDAKEDPDAVVTLVLNGVDVTCTVAPAVIFYNVYECGNSDAESAVKDVDTTAAGANVVIADGTVNNITGSYVARIYKSYELNEAGTEVVNSKKLHKYDGAFYSKMSMNVDGEKDDTGVLNIIAENEGLDSELHLTINGGYINIASGNDGINTNEDGVSVTTVNGGTLSIRVTGETGEGDGIDSNGWLVINGGMVFAEACSNSMDAGIDSDMGIYVNGGTLLAGGNMLDRIAGSEQNYAVFTFASKEQADSVYTFKNEAGQSVFTFEPKNAFSYLVFSSEDLTEGAYTLWRGDVQLAAAAGESFGGMGFGGFDGQMPPEGMEIPEGGFNGQMPEGGELPEMPEGTERPEFPGFDFEDAEKMDPGMMKPDEGNMDLGIFGGKLPEGFEGEMPPEGMEIPEGGFNGQMPEGGFGGRGDGGFGGRGPGSFGNMSDVELSTEFVIAAGGNYFSFVSAAE